MSVKIPGFKSSEALQKFNVSLTHDKALQEEAINKVKATIVVTVKNKQGKTESWLLDFKNEGKILKIPNEESKKYDGQILIGDANLKKLITGKTSAQSLFLGGKLQLRGNAQKAAIVETIFQKALKEKL